MNVVQAKLVCAKLLRAQEKIDPGGGIAVNGALFGYTQAAEELERMCEWVHPDLRTGSIKKVVECADCKFYKRYKKKGSVRPVYKYMCSKTKTERSANFFCGDGAKKKED